MFMIFSIFGAQKLLNWMDKYFFAQNQIFFIRCGKMAYRGTVLVVDDDLGPRESLRMILKPVYPVLTANTGAEALKIIGTQRVDLVTLDLRMPGMPGIEALKEIKKMNADVEEFDDGFRVRRSRLSGARLDSYGDHRIAMAFSVAALLADGETEIDGAECVAVSFPGFFDQLQNVAIYE